MYLRCRGDTAAAAREHSRAWSRDSLSHTEREWVRRRLGAGTVSSSAHRGCFIENILAESCRVGRVGHPCVGSLTPCVPDVILGPPTPRPNPHPASIAAWPSLAATRLGVTTWRLRCKRCGRTAPKPAGRFHVFLPLWIRSAGVVPSRGSHVGRQSTPVRRLTAEGPLRLGNLGGALASSC